MIKLGSGHQNCLRANLIDYSQCIHTKKTFLNLINLVLHPFQNQREYFIFSSINFLFFSFLIEVIRASQQFNCLEGKDATPPPLFIYLTAFKDTFVIQQF